MTRLLGYTESQADMLAIMDDNIMALHEIQMLIDEEFVGAARASRGEEVDSSGPDPVLVAGLNAEIWPLVDQRYQRLTELLKERERAESVQGQTDALAAFDDSIDGDRLHRYQDKWSRALGRTLREFQLARKLSDLAVDSGQWAVGSGQWGRNKANERAVNFADAAHHPT